MLLQRLMEYDNTSGNAVPRFYEYKPVRWVLALTPDGTPQGDLVDTANKGDPQQRYGRLRLVPSVTTTSGNDATLAVGKGEYVFGWLVDESRVDRAAKRHQAFQDLTEQWARAEPDGPGKAIAAFYSKGHHKNLSQPDGYDPGDLITFRVGSEHAGESDEAIRFWAEVADGRKGSGRTGICLVCGQLRSLLKTIPQQVPGRWIPGETKARLSLVSINAAVHGYELQMYLVHTPICADCGLKFTGALTRLLSDPDHSTTLPGQNARLVWWVIGGSIFDPFDTIERPHPAKIRRMLSGPATGVEADVDMSSLYCSVTVGGHAARVMVRDWVEQPIPKIKANVRAWFDDHEMIDAWAGEVTQIPVSQLVRVTGRFQGGRGGASGTWAKLGAKGEDRPQDAYYGLLRAALLGRPLPPKLLNHLIHRIRADRRVDTARAALARFALRRLLNYPHREGLTPTLNLDRKQPAYVCGRIFAIMDDLQRTVFRVADQNLNTTFAERYFGRAIDNPQVVLVTGRRNTTAWLRRLRGPLRRAHWASAYERRLDELFGQLDKIPSGAVLTDKAEFILGYHQQRADLRAERTAAAANKKKTDLPLEQDEPKPETDHEGVDA